jgi:hypothetical protein|tara:strand:+ start:2856 stop:3086 length:231 start_codon:yes stop_codon:yes gene_type:complete
MSIPDFNEYNLQFHEMVTSEEWDINRMDVAELYLNDNLNKEKEQQEEWENMDGLTIMYVPGYGRLQMIWIEEDINE